ncbi:guanine nucleotide binding protein, alpha subunit [Rhizoclosmatium globosum]|uniref:Guanine nucleotide binding protein, alpha subunit n=1 Tax=Rhizoclosmatium globosum TaxID=329046 RepID=A0A1Y2C385_9FUNG|nr:guanine nucleotide binding protein, alpha subunit [Rhizoclosmatium globosum]|eukprot:ORY41513.1 guanine nucleotide binding protein, alpha subunit [Rhizoclosmatium globosum]
MGALCSSNTDSPGAAVNREIEKAIEVERRQQQKVIKLLLLGAGETGKSTILKQFRLIYGSGFSNEERESFKTIIIVSIYQSIQTLLFAMDTLEIPFGFNPINHAPSTTLNHLHEELSTNLLYTTSNKSMKSSSSIKSSAQTSVWSSHLDKASVITDKSDRPPARKKDPYAEIASKIYRETIPLPNPVREAASRLKDMDLLSHGFLDQLEPETVDAIKTVWKDSGLQYCLRRANEFQLSDTCAFYLNDCDRFFCPGYVPTDADILNMRLMTIKVTETKLAIGKALYRIIDVGGQRLERKKWAYYFDDVLAILFVVALSSYDQVLLEAHDVNRMMESLNLFASICNHPLFKKTSMILFLNKIDIFTEKLKTSMVFLDINKYKEKAIYPYFTKATDTKQTQVVLTTVTNILVQIGLQETGFM